MRRILLSSLTLLGACAIGPAVAHGAVVHADLSYDIDSPPAPAPAAQNMLDLYAPDGTTTSDRRPVVVYVHGGGWSIGDKRNQISNKAAVFTDAGYVFASLNYRLSPSDGDPANPDPGRIRFPAHPHDVGEALGWLDRHVAAYGGDPKRVVLIGHSAGAQIISLVATDPSYIEAYDVDPWRIIGAISLDTDAFDITAEADPANPEGNNPELLWNAFATPAENAVDGSWAAGSPVRWADPGDPPFLLVTSLNPNRRADNARMATALGQDPAGVLAVPYDHAGINQAVGGPDDPAGETAAIMAFIARELKAARAPKAKLRSHPPHRLRAKGRKTRVRFRFGGGGEGGYECRIDSRAFRRCKPPQRFALRAGLHAFRVRALSERGRPGPARSWRFRIKPR